MFKLASCLSTILAWFLLVVILGLSAIGLITSRFGWQIYLELLSHFQLQYFVLSLVALTGLALTRHRLLLLIGLACTIGLATQIVPWYLPPHLLVQKTGNFRILIANLNGQNQQYQEVLAYAQQEKPDLALFMEVNRTWVNSLNSLRSHLPYSSETDDSSDGNALYSRYPLRDIQVKRFTADSTFSILGRIELEGQSFAFVATHPWPPVKPHWFHSRNQQLDQVSQYLRSVQAPKLVIGDLNITMWSPYYKRLIHNTGLKNARQGFGILPSWPTPGTFRYIPAWLTHFLSIPIDHCLLSPEITVTQVRVGPRLGSDHRPLIVDLKV